MIMCSIYQVDAPTLRQKAEYSLGCGGIDEVPMPKSWKYLQTRVTLPNSFHTSVNIC